MLISTLREGFAKSVRDNEPFLCYGYTRDFGDVFCRGVRVKGGYSISMKTKGGALSCLEIINGNEEEKQLTLDINPEFDSPAELTRVKIAPKSAFLWKSENGSSPN